MITLCLLASAGSALAVFGIVGAMFVVMGSDKPTAPAAVAFLALVFLAIVGMGSCAAEDRICQVAGLEA